MSILQNLKGWRLQRKQFKATKEWRAQTQACYVRVLGGRDADTLTVLADMCRAHNVFGPAFDPNPLELARMAGERNVVTRILHILNMPPGRVAELSEEGFNDLPMDVQFEKPDIM